ncbi:cytosine permease [Citricoccus sp. GCM10030269]|uniref:cytosine permease n=1 Tax=Citricoccus sp. GCM10030269 TaxID=3273388 RepID=UPI003619FFCC
MVILGFLFFTPTMVAAADVAVAFDFPQFLVLAGVAAAVLAIYISLMGVVSSRTGLTTVLVSRTVFGKVGGKWASFILGGTQVAWYGITLTTLSDLLGMALGWDITWPIAVIGGILMALSAYIGMKGIELLSWISVPLMLALCIWVFVLATNEVGGLGGFLQLEGNGTVSTGAALTILISTFISGGTQVGNWSRFARYTSATFGILVLCVILGQFTMFFFGGVGAAAFGEGDFVELLLMLGLIGAGLILLVANLWTTNDNAAYAYGVAGSEFFGKADKRPFVIGGTILGIIISVSGMGGMLIPFLNMLGVLIPPLGGAIIGMYFLVWRGRTPDDLLQTAPLVRVSGLIAYVAGAVAAGIGTAFDLGSPAVQGIIVAALVAPLAAVIERKVSAA